MSACGLCARIRLKIYERNNGGSVGSLQHVDTLSPSSYILYVSKPESDAGRDNVCVCLHQLCSVTLFIHHYITSLWSVFLTSAILNHSQHVRHDSDKQFVCPRWTRKWSATWRYQLQIKANRNRAWMRHLSLCHLARHSFLWRTFRMCFSYLTYHLSCGWKPAYDSFFYGTQKKYFISFLFIVKIIVVV